MKFAILILIFIILNKSFDLSEILTIGKDDFIFGRIGDINFTSDGNIIVTDDMLYTVNMFSHNGKLIRKTGSRGEGPGEYTVGPHKIATSGKYIAVVDITTPRINLYSEDLIYEKTILAPCPVNDLLFISDDALLLNCSVLTKDLHLVIIDLNGNIISKIDSPAYQGDMLLDMVLLDKLNNGDIVVVYIFKNVIQIFSAEGELKVEFSIHSLPPEGPVVEKRGPIELRKLLINDIAIDSNDAIYLLLGEGATNNIPYRDVYRISKKGAYIDKFKLKNDSGLLKLFNDQYIFTREEERTVLRKYHLSKQIEVK